MSQARLDRIDRVLKVLEERGGRATYRHLIEIIVKTVHVSLVTAERYVAEMATMGRIKAEGAFWVITLNQEEA
jgi:hypothetical protein